MEVYHWASCSTCRAERERLRARGVQTGERDFFAQPLNRAELVDLATKAGGIRRIFSFGSPSFRRLNREPASLSEEEMLDYVLGEPRFLRRPLAVAGGRVLIGREVGEVGP